MSPRRHVVASVLESDPDSALDRLRELPAACGLAELRADHLTADRVAGIVRRSPVPLIVTVRSVDEGGAFRGSRAERRRILQDALEAGARLVDVPWEDDPAELDRFDPSRVILSHHGEDCRARRLVPLYRAMASTAAARLKIVPRARKVGELGAVRGLLERAVGEGRDLACFALGRAGAVSRLLALAWGSWATYGSTGPGRETAPGQFTVSDLLEVHDVAGIGSETRLHGLVGGTLSASPSPAMHDAAYRHDGIDARYLPLEVESVEDVRYLANRAGAVGVRGFGVTIPFKETVAGHCNPGDAWSRSAGAVNTVRVEAGGWVGFNTDASGAATRIRDVLDPAGLRATVLGAGGTARTLAVVLRSLGARVTVVNRTESRAREAAEAAGVAWGRWDERSRPGADILVNATPLGTGGEAAVEDTGMPSRLVVDVAYAPVPTPLVVGARSKGVAVVDGVDFLVAQAEGQYRLLTGSDPSRAVLRESAIRYLARLGSEGEPS